MAHRPTDATPFNEGVTDARKKQWGALKIHHMEAIKDMVTNSTMYDPTSLRNRQRRSSHLRDFEHFCSEQLHLNEHSAVWDKDTIIENQKMYIAAVAEISKGVLGVKVKGILICV
jgi:hypothetical protein